VDWVEQPLMGLVPSLQPNRALKVEVVETKGLIGFLRFNQLFTPFDSRCGIFTTATPLANDAGMEALSGKHDIAGLKRELEAVEYKGKEPLNA
jgi:hypothetical protein